MKQARDIADTISTEDFADLVGLTVRRINQLTADGTIPKIGHGVLPLRAAVKALFASMRHRTEKPDTTEDDEHKSRMLKAKADTAVMEAEAMAGRLVPVEDVAKTWQNVAANVRAKITAIASKAAPIAFAATSVEETFSAIEAAQNEALTELSGAANDLAA